MAEAFRIRKGWNQADLAKEVNLSQGQISKIESGDLPLTLARAEAIASALGVPPDALVAPAISPRIPHRFPARMPAKARNDLKASFTIAHVQVERLLAGTRTPPFGAPPPSLSGFMQAAPEDRAIELRQRWGIWRDPVEDLIGLLESRGIVCGLRDLSASGVAAVASWPKGGRPLVIIDRSSTPFPQRLAIAHELGHLAMVEQAGPEQERHATQFANEFLMPAAEIRRSLADGNDLRSEAIKWHVPLPELAKRAQQLGEITRDAFRRATRTAASDNDLTEAPPARPSLVRAAIAERMTAGETREEIAASALRTMESITWPDDVH